MGPLDSSWYQGPTSDLPLTETHGRSILALDLDISGDKVVTASADHGLRLYNLRTGKQLRQLYSKRYGHTDWVTTCAFLNDGRVLSGSMDKRLCLWDKGAVKCTDLVGHNGPISKVKVDQNNVAISSGYDASLLVWTLDSHECANGLFNGHKEAVLEFEWNNSLCVSGDKGGTIAFWDINRGEPLKTIKAHTGAVGKISLFSDGGQQNLVMTTGLRDGRLNIFDMRTSKVVKFTAVHKGAINLLAVSENSGNIITGSADKTLKMWDMRTGGRDMKSLMTMQATDAVFCGELIDYGNLAIVGSGDGNLLAYDLMNGGECLYGYGADSVGAVHCLAVARDFKSVVTGGDSGQALKINFGGF